MFTITEFEILWKIIKIETFTDFGSNLAKKLWSVSYGILSNLLITTNVFVIIEIGHYIRI